MDYYRALLQKLIGSTPDPADARGIVPVSSPIDLIAGGVGSKLGDAATGAIDAASGALSEKAAQGATDAINAQNLAKNAAIQRLLSQGDDGATAQAIQNYQNAAPGTAELPSAIQQKLNSIGSNAPAAVVKTPTVEEYLNAQGDTNPVIDLGKYRDNAPTASMSQPAVDPDAPTDPDIDAKLEALRKLRGQ